MLERQVRKRRERNFLGVPVEHWTNFVCQLSLQTRISWGKIGTSAEEALVRIWADSVGRALELQQHSPSKSGREIPASEMVPTRPPQTPGWFCILDSELTVCSLVWDWLCCCNLLSPKEEIRFHNKCRGTFASFPFWGNQIMNGKNLNSFSFKNLLKKKEEF